MNPCSDLQLRQTEEGLWSDERCGRCDGCLSNEEEIRSYIERWRQEVRSGARLKYDPLAVDEHVCFPGHVPVRLRMEPWWRRLLRRVGL